MTDTLGKNDGLIESLVRMLDPDGVIVAVTATMVILAVIDLVTFFDRPLPWRREAVQHRDLKTAIVSLGILGTFIGITIGLVQFDASDTLKIHENIPGLLSGLKVAFFTSVVGMALSILLAVIQRLVDANAGRDNTEQLNKIANLIEQGNEASREGFENLRAGHVTLQRGLVSVGDKISGLSDNVSRTGSEILQRLDTVNTTLEQALERIVQDANREIIEMLREVVREFNIIIQEQFGESLRQLSQACEKLLEWQKQHKEEVDAVHDQLLRSIEVLTRATEALDSSAEKLQTVGETCERIEAVIVALNRQTQITADHLEEYASVANQVKETLAEVTDGINEAQSAIADMATESHTKFKEHIELQRDTLESMRETAERIEEINSSVATHTETTQAELNAQARQVTGTMEEMINGLRTALGEMQDVFVEVTEKLASSYEEHLRYLREKVETLSECLREIQQTLRGMKERTDE